MSYVREDGLAQARRRRQRRSIIVIILATVLVAGAFYYAVKYITRTGADGPAASSSCQPTAEAPVQSLFVLNIYNASSGSGRAKKVGIAMKSRGFDVGTVSNDPYKEKLTGVGQIRFGPKGKRNATEFVQRLMPDAKLSEDGRSDDSVDVVLGDDAPTIAAAPQTSTAPPPSCAGAQ